MRPTCFLLIAGLVAAPSALAQEPSYAGDWGWVKVGLGAHQPTDVAVHPSRTGVWAVASLTGEVWLTEDGGVTFASVLEAMSADLDPEQAIEDQMRELADELRDAVSGLDPYDPATAEDPEVQALQQQILDLEGRLEVLRAQDAEGPKTGDLATLPRVWFDGDALFAGRTDGLWRSDDLGASWRQVLDLPTRALARVPGRALWAAGTSDGVRFSTDGVAWLDPEDRTEGLGIYDLEPAQSGLYAATSDGLWFAADAQQWHKVGGSGQIFRVRPDPDWATGAWVSTPRAILRTDDGGKTFEEPLGAPIAGVLSLLWLGTGHLLVASADGVWESIDAGTTWQPRENGLSEPKTRSLAQDGATILLASEEGLFELAFGRRAAPPQAAARPFIPLNALLHQSVDRPEMNQSAGNRSVAYLLPRLTITSAVGATSDLAWALSTGTQQGSSFDWGITASVSWSHPATTSLDNQLFLPNEGMFLLDDVTPSPAFSAMTTRDAVSYKTVVANQVTDLYYTRARFAQEQASGSSLQDQVERALRIQEIDARLDALCDGAVTLWERDPGEVPAARNHGKGGRSRLSTLNFTRPEAAP
jgi:hypothetical protein